MLMNTQRNAPSSSAPPGEPSDLALPAGWCYCLNRFTGNRPGWRAAGRRVGENVEGSQCRKRP